MENSSKLAGNSVADADKATQALEEINTAVTLISDMATQIDPKHHVDQRCGRSVGGQLTRQLRGVEPAKRASRGTQRESGHV